MWSTIGATIGVLITAWGCFAIYNALVSAYREPSTGTAAGIVLVVGIIALFIGLPLIWLSL